MEMHTSFTGFISYLYTWMSLYVKCQYLGILIFKWVLCCITTDIDLSVNIKMNKGKVKVWGYSPHLLADFTH